MNKHNRHNSLLLNGKTLTMIKRRKFHKYSIFLILLFTTVIAGTAQQLCEEITREIFESTEANCAETANERACYGFDNISVTFFEDIGDSFTNPGDVLEMSQIHTLHSNAFDEELEEWGIGYFRIGLEESDEPLIIIVAGDVIVEQDRQAAAEAGLAPMQAFNFTTAGPSSCTEAPNAVFIQSPPDIDVDLVVNSTPIRIGSTIVLGTYDENTEDDAPQDDTMWIAVVEGEAVIDPESDNPVILPEGNASTVDLTDEDGENDNGDNVLNPNLVPVLDPLTGEPILGLDGEPFYRQIPEEEFSEPIEITEDGTGFLNWESFAFIENVPSGLLNYDVDVPTVNDDEEPATTSSNTNPPPVVTEEPVLANDDSVTECGTLNWCNAGEPWGDGRCTTDWDWNAGWYNAQLECGAIDSIPPEYGGVEETTVIHLPSAGCVPDVGYYTNYGGGYFVPENTPYYSDPQCTVEVGNWSAPQVYAPPGFDAYTLCNYNGSFTSATDYGDNIYTCNY